MILDMWYEWERTEEPRKIMEGHHRGIKLYIFFN